MNKKELVFRVPGDCRAKKRAQTEQHGVDISIATLKKSACLYFDQAPLHDGAFPARASRES